MPGGSGNVGQKVYNAHGTDFILKGDILLAASSLQGLSPNAP